MDVVYRRCSKPVWYDGEWDGLFHVTKKDIYIRELLDSWSYEVCGKGATFRESFDTWFERSSSITSVMHKFNEQKLVGRRQANYPFSLFLKSFTFRSQSHLES